MTETDVTAAAMRRVLPPRTYETLTVLVPVYNERTTVAEVIRRMRAVELPVVLQIIVVDDGSSDGSDKVLGAIEDSTVRVLRHEVNQGKGAPSAPDWPRRGDLLLFKMPISSTTQTTGPACSNPFCGARHGWSTAAGSPASART